MNKIKSCLKMTICIFKDHIIPQTCSQSWPKSWPTKSHGISSVAVKGQLLAVGLLGLLILLLLLRQQDLPMYQQTSFQGCRNHTKKHCNAGIKITNHLRMVTIPTICGDDWGMVYMTLLYRHEWICLVFVPNSTISNLVNRAKFQELDVLL